MKNNKNKMTSFSQRLAITAALLVSLVITFSIYVWTEKQIDTANELRYQSFLLADELRQTSDDLTRMMRLYVESGNPRYKGYYQTILAIRNGNKERPANYRRIYWDFVLAKTKPAPVINCFEQNNQLNGEKSNFFIQALLTSLLPPIRPCLLIDKPQRIALLTLMQQTKMSTAELVKLAQAKQNSDALVAIELKAMQLMESSTDKEANKAKARALMHSFEYHQNKAAIMKPIDEFFSLLDNRTWNRVREAEIHAIVLRCIFIFLGVSLMLMLWRTFVVLRLTLGGSVDELYLQIAKIGSGDFNHSIRVAKGLENSVLGWLSETQEKLKTIDGQRVEASEKIQLAHKKINDSIDYASLIQKAILPNQQLIDFLGDYQSVIWQPCDVVGGDFYVFHASEQTYLLGVVDCAGHGVPGALMTMLARAALDHAIAEKGIASPAALLQKMDATLRNMLQDVNMPRGLAATMDAGLVFVDPLQQQVLFSGAKMSLYWTDGQQVDEIKGKGRVILGNRIGQYDNIAVAIKKDMIFCLTSDGVLDQAGGTDGFGFGNNRFTQLLCQSANLSPVKQAQAMMNAINDYRGHYPQRDDITMLFFKPQYKQREN